jgi:hypothetical protein
MSWECGREQHHNEWAETRDRGPLVAQMMGNRPRVSRAAIGQAALAVSEVEMPALVNWSCAVRCFQAATATVGPSPGGDRRHQLKTDSLPTAATAHECQAGVRTAVP